MPDPLPALAIQFLTEDPEAAFPWEARLGALGRRLLREEGVQATAVNVVLCSDETIRRLNRDYRHHDKVTDVLSFEFHEPDFLGEIYICEEQVRRQAPAYGNTFYAELKRVMVHGLLHLLGYDHIKPADRVKMRKRECEVLKINYYQDSNG